MMFGGTFYDVRVYKKKVKARKVKDSHNAELERITGNWGHK